MAHIDSYSHFVTANVPAEAWDEAWMVLTTWKGFLQSFPGSRTIRISARPLDNGDVRVLVFSVWSYPEDLEEWRASEYSASSLLSQLSRPAYDISEETLEDFS